MSDPLPSHVLDNFASHLGTVHAAMQPAQGMNSAVWQLQTSRGAFVIKRNSDNAESAGLDREVAVLQSLAAHVPLVPRFVARTGEYALFTCLGGVNLAVTFAQATTGDAREELAVEYGRLLRTVHRWEPSVPRPDDWLGDAIARAERNAQEVGLDSLVSSCGLWDGKLHRVVWEEIRVGADNVTPHLVFCHGDWCLPNIMITDGRATGTVDWSDGGWADYRTDLAMGLWSLRYNSTTLLKDPGTERYCAAFLRGYGYDEPINDLRFWEALSLLY